MRRNRNRCKFGESKADIRIISEGKDAGEAIENSFSCFFSYVFDLEEVGRLKKWAYKEFAVESGDIEDIAHDIYSEIIYLIYTKETVVKGISLKMDKTVKVIAKTARTKSFSNCLRGEIKAITYHNLNIREENDKVVLDLTFDV